MEDYPFEFRKHRLSSFDTSAFFLKEEDHPYEMHDHPKVDNLRPENQNFGFQGLTDYGLDLTFSNKLHDSNLDYYRITRSRGPSFNLGPGRKNSEDLFSHGFELLNYCTKNFEQPNNDRNFIQGFHEPRLQMGAYEDLKTAPLMSQGMPGNFGPLAQNNCQNPDDQELPQESEKEAEFEPKNQKKKKNNNKQEVLSKKEFEEPASITLKKAKSENKKSSNKSVTPKPIVKKGSTVKSSKSKKVSEEMRVKSELASTEVSSTTVSPIPKKEEFNGLVKSKSSIIGSFGHFKKPESAQELLSGLSLSAEVEEYINNSKLFNQIKAPQIKKIGTLTIEERRLKVERYLEKRKRRSWNKRVNYDCRKKVADNRLRIKGRFVTRDQAFSMLESCGIFPDPDKITNDEIKELLIERFGGILKKKENTTESGGDNKIAKNMKTQNLDGSEDDSTSETYLKF